jgi:hypothetical protein
MSSIDNYFGNDNSAPHVSLGVGFEFLENITIASSNYEKCVVHDRQSFEVYIKKESESRSRMMKDRIFSFESHTSSSTTFWNICCDSCEFYGHNNEWCRFERERTPKHFGCTSPYSSFILFRDCTRHIFDESLILNHTRKALYFVEGEQADAGA